MRERAIERLISAGHEVGENVISFRRDFHRFAEVAWTELRTGSIIARRLLELADWKVEYGPQLYDKSLMMGMPSEEELEADYRRALGQGADPEIVESMKGGFTGVLATLKVGDGVGPVVALRFDIDANDLEEAKDEAHRPFRDGFSSINPNAMHGCGHDCHASMGLGLAKVLSACRDVLPSGTVKLIFQTGEEGGRGGKPMAATGMADDADFFAAIHVSLDMPTGTIACGVKDLICTTKMDAKFVGKSAHAGGTPQSGQNALLAACNAAVNLYAITRHSDGFTRVNVGVLKAGVGRNVIAPEAQMKFEVRGQTSGINEFMTEKATAVVNGAAEMYGVKVEIAKAGECISVDMDPEMIELVKNAARLVPGINEALEVRSMKGGGEDCTFFMERIQRRGGKATIVNLGTSGAAVLHNSYFDVDESALPIGVQLLGIVTLEALSRR